MEKRERRKTGSPVRFDLKHGFTLVETLAAISLLMIAIVAPMSLTEQSLRAAYYARDQITAYYLAQEALEAVRAIRDNNILVIAEGSSNPPCSPMTLFCGIIPSGQTASGPFTIDATLTNAAITPCSNTCPPISTDGTLYGYNSTWTPTYFTRTVTATYTDATENEVRVTVTVTWQTGAFQARSFSISEDMYRWIDDGSGA